MPIDLYDNDVESNEEQLTSTSSVHNKESEDPLTQEINNAYNQSKIINSLIPSLSRFKETILSIVSNSVTNSEIVQNGTRLSFEIISENERGVRICGIQLFSPLLLVPSVDPVSQFVDIKGCSIGDDLKIYSTNCIDAGYDDEMGEKWRWCWGQWYVLCFDGDINVTCDDELDEVGDVVKGRKSSRALFCDYEGWFYARSFGGTKWHGEFSLMKGYFCRRRLLIRLKEKVRD